MITFDEPYTCPICRSSLGSTRQPYKGKSPGFANKTIAECACCHVLHIFPLPTEEEINTHYAAYWDAQYLDSMFPLFAKQAESRVAFLRPYLPDDDPLTVLDIGAGFGLIHKALTAVLSSREIWYDAVEVDPLAIKYLNNRIRPRALYRSINETKERYHVIILSHILEHMRDPLLFLRQHQRMLHDNGVVFVEVPNQDFLFKAQNEPHLFFFSPQYLISLMTSAGYDVLDVRTCGQSIRAMQSDARSNNPARNFVRRIIPRPAQDLLRRVMARSSAHHTARSISEYRDDGRWIRMAVKRTTPSSQDSFDHVNY